MVKESRLQVIGGNAAIHGSFLLNTSEGVVLAAEAETRSEWNALKVSKRPGGVLNPVGVSDLRCVLRGPSGKGEYQLEIGPVPQVVNTMMVGSIALYEGWRFVQDHGRTLLRHEVDAAISRWIAVPRKSEAGTMWSFWWYSPNAASMEDFDEYVVVDLEVVA